MRKSEQEVVLGQPNASAWVMPSLAGATATLGCPGLPLGVGGCNNMYILP